MNWSKLKQISLIFLVFILMAGMFGMQASAYDEQNYVLDADGYQLPIPVTYNAESVTRYLSDEAGQLSSPTDIFITKSDRMYIVDGGNNRIVSMNCDGTDVKTFSNFSGETLSNPNGIYVYEDSGDMLIADTDNGRLLLTDKDGNLKKIYTQPESELYDKTYPFKPLKVAVNLIGQIYVINTDDYHGFVVLDEAGELRGYMAPTKVPFDLVYRLASIFATEEQLSRMEQPMPPVHTNLFIDDDNYIYTTTGRGADEGQLMVFSPVGKNIYPFTGAFGEERTDYVLRHYNVNADSTEQNFVDVVVDDGGIVSILDSVTGRIYQYDSEGNNLTVFGGVGVWEGRFQGASGMAMDSQGNIYVVDQTQSSLHKFVPTQFTNLIHTALGLYYDGKYDEAVEYWDQVLELNPNYPMAHVGRGNAYLRNDQYEEAIEEFRLADNKAGYSDAFDENELQFVRQNFAFVLLAIIAIVVLVVLLIMYLHKRYKQTYEKQSRIKWFNNRGRLQILLGCIFDPNEGFRNIRRHRQDYDIVIPLIIYALIFVAKCFSLFVTHYPFQATDIARVNLAQETLMIFLPLLTWVVGNYLVTTIRSGEVKMREVFSASAYSMLPYVIITIPLACVSNVMSLSSSGIYNGITVIMWVWIGILFFASTMSMNSYRFFETVGIIINALFACVFMWVVFAMIFMLGNEVVSFFTGIFENWQVYFSMQGGNV